MQMRIKNLVPTALLGSLVWLIAASAIAAPPTPDRPNPDKIEGWCGENGGAYWPPTAENSNTYGCALPDGTLVLCQGQLCETHAETDGFPSGKVPLTAVSIVQHIKTQEQLTDLSSKLQQLQVEVEDLALLVVDACDPPVILE